MAIFNTLSINKCKLEDIYFTIPLSFSAGNFNNFDTSVINIIDHLKKDIGDKFDPKIYYACEIAPVIKSVPSLKKGKYLFIDLGGGSCDYCLAEVENDDGVPKPIINESIKMAGEYFRKIENKDKKEIEKVLYPFTQILFYNIGLNLQKIYKKGSPQEPPKHQIKLCNEEDIDKVYLFGNTWNKMTRDNYKNIFKIRDGFDIIDVLSTVLNIKRDKIEVFQHKDKKDIGPKKIIAKYLMERQKVSGEKSYFDLMDSKQYKEFYYKKKPGLGKIALFGFTLEFGQKKFDWFEEISEKDFTDVNLDAEPILKEDELKSFFKEDPVLRDPGLTLKEVKEKIEMHLKNNLRNYINEFQLSGEAKPFLIQAFSEIFSKVFIKDLLKLD